MNSITRHWRIEENNGFGWQWYKSFDSYDSYKKHMNVLKEAFPVTAFRTLYTETKQEWLKDE